MSKLGSELRLAAASRASGSVALPGSKSISNRTLLLAALSAGETVVRGLLRSDDTAVMLAALGKLGVNVEALGGDVGTAIRSALLPA